MRAISAAPRVVAANTCSIATTDGRRATMVSSASGIARSLNTNSSTVPSWLCLSSGCTSAAAMSTVHGGFTRTGLEDLRFLERPPSELHLADDILLPPGPPVAAVETVVAVIAHDEVVPGLDYLGAEVVVAAELLGHIVVVQRDVVDVNAPVDDLQRIARLGD